MMDRRMMLLVIGLVFGSGIGFLVAASNGVTLDGHDHASGHNIQDGGHDHTAMQPVSLASGAGAPTLAATVVKDPMSGWNLQIIVTNFRFTPQSASLTHVDGEGHAHAYVNGEKIARVYGNWLHIENLPEGDVTIEVALNSNDHRPLAVGDDLLRVSVPVSN